MGSKRDEASLQEKEGLSLWLFAWGDVARVGGTEQRMADAAHELSKRGVHVTSLIRAPKRSNAFHELIWRNMKSLIFQQRWTTYYKTLADFDGSVVWTFGLKQSIVARIAKLIHNVPWVLIMPRNGLDHEWKPWMHWLDRLSQRLVDLYVTNSYSVRSHLIDHGIHTDRVVAVPSGLAEKWYSNPPSAVQTSFLMVGNHRPQKNQLRGVEAFVTSDIASTLTVYTDDATEIKSYLAKTDGDARGHVNVIEGHQLEPEDFDAYGVLLHPSVSESRPLTILEAQSRGCFVLAGDTGDTGRLISEENGLLFDPESVEDIREKIAQAHNILSKRRTRFSGDKKLVEGYVTEIVDSISQVGGGK